MRAWADWVKIKKWEPPGHSKIWLTTPARRNVSYSLCGEQNKTKQKIFKAWESQIRVSIRHSCMLAALCEEVKIQIVTEQIKSINFLQEDNYYYHNRGALWWFVNVLKLSSSVSLQSFVHQKNMLSMKTYFFTLHSKYIEYLCGTSAYFWKDFPLEIFYFGISICGKIPSTLTRCHGIETKRFVQNISSGVFYSVWLYRHLQESLQNKLARSFKENPRIPSITPHP